MVLPWGPGSPRPSLTWALPAAAMLELLLLEVAIPAALAQGASDSPGLQLSTDALSIIGYVLIGSFAMASLIFAMLGFIVGLQWPNPNICCYTNAYSDSPRGRGCCSLYRLNFSFAVLWVVFFIVSAVSRRIKQLIICLGFALVHISVVAHLRHKFNGRGLHDGRAAADADTELPTAAIIANMMRDNQPGGAGRARPIAGIPVFNIPIQSAVVGKLTEADACVCAACKGRPLPEYAYSDPSDAGDAGLAHAMAAAMARVGGGREQPPPPPPPGGAPRLPVSPILSISPATPAPAPAPVPTLAMPVAGSVLVVAEGVPVVSRSQRRLEASRLHSSVGRQAVAGSERSGVALLQQQQPSRGAAASRPTT